MSEKTKDFIFLLLSFVVLWLLSMLSFGVDVLASERRGPTELNILYGKGVSHNPNMDLSMYSLSWRSGAIGDRKLRTSVFTGEAYGFTGVGGARPFKMWGIGKEIEFSEELNYIIPGYRKNSGEVFMRLGTGVAVFSRTVDAEQYGMAPYGQVSVGISYRSASISFSRFHASKSGISDPWTHQEYDAPTFQGFMISTKFALKR